MHRRSHLMLHLALVLLLPSLLSTSAHADEKSVLGSSGTTAKESTGSAGAGEEASDNEAEGDGGSVPVIEVEVIASHEWPAKVETVTAEQAEAMVNAPYVPDVLERLPGADTLTGCPAGAPLITIRGNNSEWTQILLDGIPVSPMGRPYIVNFISMSSLESIQLLKGPIPPKYAGTTIAGLVLLDMKTGDRYPGTSLSTTVGDYGQRILDVNVGGGNADRNYFLAFTHNEMDGWLPHTDMDLATVAGKVVLTPDPHSKLTLVGHYLFGDKFGPRPEGPNPSDKWAAEWTDLSQPKASLTYRRILSERSDIMVRFVPYWFSGTQTWNQWFTDHAELRFMPWEYDLLRTEVQHDVRTRSDRIWTWGASWQKDVYSYAGPLKISAWGAIPATAWREYAKRGRSLFVQHSLPTSNGGTLTLGARSDSEEPGSSVTTPFFSWHERAGDNTRVRLALTRNRRFPQLIELYGQGMWVGNPDAEPELGWTYQADVDWTLPSGLIGLSVFQSDLQNLIVADARNVFANLGESRLRGLEFSWQRSHGSTSWWANYAYLDAQNPASGEPLIVAFRTAFPKHSAKLGVTVQDARGGEHSVEVLAYGRRQTDVDAPVFVGEPWNVTVPPSLPGFTWVNYKYSREVGAGSKLTLAVENILGVEAEDLLFYPRPGRWVSGTLSWRF